MKYLRKEGESGLFVGNGASNGDEFALFDFSFESDSLFDCGVGTWITAAAAGGGDHGSLDSDQWGREMMG